MHFELCASLGRSLGKLSTNNTTEFKHLRDNITLETFRLAVNCNTHYMHNKHWQVMTNERVRRCCAKFKSLKHHLLERTTWQNVNIRVNAAHEKSLMEWLEQWVVSVGSIPNLGCSAMSERNLFNEVSFSCWFCWVRSIVKGVLGSNELPAPEDCFKLVAELLSCQAIQIEVDRVIGVHQDEADRSGDFGVMQKWHESQKGDW